MLQTGVYALLRNSVEKKAHRQKLCARRRNPLKGC